MYNIFFPLVIFACFHCPCRQTGRQARLCLLPNVCFTVHLLAIFLAEASWSLGFIPQIQTFFSAFNAHFSPEKRRNGENCRNRFFIFGSFSPFFTRLTIHISGTSHFWGVTHHRNADLLWEILRNWFPNHSSPNCRQMPISGHKLLVAPSFVCTSKMFS